MIQLINTKKSDNFLFQTSYYLFIHLLNYFLKVYFYISIYFNLIFIINFY